MRNKFVFKLNSNYKPTEHNNIHITSITFIIASHLALVFSFIFFFCNILLYTEIILECIRCVPMESSTIAYR